MEVARPAALLVVFGISQLSLARIELLPLAPRLGPHDHIPHNLLI
jgi:hypothetical protein